MISFWDILNWMSQKQLKMKKRKNKEEEYAGV